MVHILAIAAGTSPTQLVLRILANVLTILVSVISIFRIATILMAEQMQVITQYYRRLNVGAIKNVIMSTPMDN